jgi:microcystin-dependent protein
MFGSPTIPTGWLLCDGSEYVTATYPTLSALLGTTFGAPSVGTNFKVPDLRQKFPVGSQAVTSNAYNYGLGQTGGEQVHALTEQEMPAHLHTYTAYLATISSEDTGGGNKFRTDTASTQNTSLTGGIAGATGPQNGVAHNTVPPFLALNFIIKT